MKIRRILWTALLIVFSSSHLQAEQKTINIAIGFSLGPYILSNGDGILGDIITESFSHSDQLVNFNFYSNADAIKAFTDKKYDAVAIVKPGLTTGHLSGPIISFNNRLIALQESGIKISSLNDLKNYKVIGFSNASKFMGSNFKRAITQAKEYKEIEDQQKQVEALYKGETDIILADEVIFEYYRKRLRYKNPLSPLFHKKVEYKFQFAPSYYYISFHDEKLKSAFAKGFKKLTQSGRVDDIYNHYSGLLVSY
jgi:polar amino acid transport system substrate-binding protein